ncbi:MAG: biotin-dependent carboxyltransferase family protein [Firmicutes bacterium]|nr:biotin-dependent carboxyltransferase family protein [Bacillota bacterium]
MTRFLEILDPGLLTTVQDHGRLAYLHMGIPESGCMDRRAFRSANHLLGNPLGAPVLEMLYKGITARFTEDTRFVLTGGDMQAKLNGQPVATYQPLLARAGDVLTLSTCVTGRYGYLAMEGGFSVPSVLGSCSTYLKCGLGGFEGRALKAGDRVEIGGDSSSPALSASSPASSHALASGDFDTAPPAYLTLKEKTIRVILGPQEHCFTRAGIRTFLSTPYTVSAASDRMGYRLEGTAIETKAGSDILSDGTVFGSIQVPSSGLPIALLADRQTTGGYAKIATVLSADLPALVQSMPGTVVRFRQAFRQ